MIHVDAMGSQKPILRSTPIFPPPVPPSSCSMAPLFLPLLATLVLAWIPAALADALEGDSSGKQPHSGSPFVSYISPVVGRSLLSSPKQPLSASRDHGGTGSIVEEGLRRDT